MEPPTLLPPELLTKSPAFRFNTPKNQLLRDQYKIKYRAWKAAVKRGKKDVIRKRNYITDKGLKK